jgi:hypothetical protein
MYTNWVVGAQCTELTVYQDKVVMNLSLERAILIRDFCGNSQSLQSNAGMVSSG